ncbi:hypothetical protein H4219_004907 [Mycoemilia scoparia]|uniref:NADPH--hemoprotein reductase n=1 Tax=Mycoemilia scoparia TaxID=417184 RepID=A0A9W7ZR08_9FUNG|nr:hypothetical protein H4219_004907 [Mycoemilia scoparia]
MVTAIPTTTPQAHNHQQEYKKLENSLLLNSSTLKTPNIQKATHINTTTDFPSGFQVLCILWAGIYYPLDFIFKSVFAIYSGIVSIGPAVKQEKLKRLSQQQEFLLQGSRKREYNYSDMTIEFSDTFIITSVVIGTVTFLLRKKICEVIGKSSSGIVGNKYESANLVSSSSSTTKATNGTSNSSNQINGSGGDSSSSERDFVQKMHEGKKNIVIFFGSQTGTAEDFANRLAREATSFHPGLHPIVLDPENYDYKYMTKMNPTKELIIWVLATTGEGEPTDNMQEWYEALVSDPENIDDGCEVPEFYEDDDVSIEVFEQPLKNKVAYIGFGLGNTTYEQFCANMRHIDKRMSTLGAKRLAPCGEGDDDSNLEEDFSNWKEGIWPIICDHLKVDDNAVTDADGVSATAAAASSLEWIVEDIGQEESLDNSTTSTSSRPFKRGEMVPDTHTGPYDAKHPFMAPIKVAYNLSPEGERSVLHLEIDLAGSGMKYETGDHLAIFPTNHEEEVQAFLKVLRLSDKANNLIKVTNADPYAAHANLFPSSTTTYVAALRHYLDIASPPAREQIRMSVLPYAKSEAATELLKSLSSDKEAYSRSVVDSCLTVAGLLQLVNRVEEKAGVSEQDQLVLPFGALLSLCSRIVARYYSISSSSLVNPKIPSITAVVLQYQSTSSTTTQEGEEKNDGLQWRYGVATNYLDSITRYLTQKSRGDKVDEYVLVKAEPGNVKQVSHTIYPDLSTADEPSSLPVVHAPVYVRHSNFRLPTDPSKPVVMVGPGTGIAPFRGFLQERVHQLASNNNGSANTGATVLFFGSRHEKTDYLYKSELLESFEQLSKSNSDSSLFTAFSRDQAHKIYVQHRMQEQAKLLWKLLHEQGGSFYVCGEARYMARDVRDTLIRIAQQEGGLALADAEAWVSNDLKKSGRYQEDIWA